MVPDRFVANRKKSCILKTGNHYMSDRRIVWIVLIILAIITLPYIAGFIFAGKEWTFGGFLLNPLDGNSYLAKMQEGVQGSWSFTLPYTAQPGEGTYLFLLYLFLGQTARLSNLPPIFIFHIARLIGFLFLYFALYRFIQAYYENDCEKTWLTFLLAALGSGVGWILLPFNIKTSDLWVAEAYPFLSSFQNPHFPAGLGLMVWIAYLFYRGKSRITWLWILFCGLMLAVILPFGAVVIGVAILCEQVWAFLRKDTLHPTRIGALILGTLPWVAYQYLTVRSDPQLSNWNLQNLTPSPPFWDFLVSFSPAVFLALAAIFIPKDRIKSDLFYFLVSWLIAGVLIIYLPIGIQRRFLAGYFIPVSILASGILFILMTRKTRIIAFSALLASTSITLVFILLAGISSIYTHNPIIYLNNSESQVMRWINTNTRPGEVILADSRMGLFIPSWTFARVIYGHPFETIDAQRNRGVVESFFGCDLTEPQTKELLTANQVRYIFTSDSDVIGCYPSLFFPERIVFQSDDRRVTLWDMNDR